MINYQIKLFKDINLHHFLSISSNAGLQTALFAMNIFINQGKLTGMMDMHSYSMGDTTGDFEDSQRYKIG